MYVQMYSIIFPFKHNLCVGKLSPVKTNTPLAIILIIHSKVLVYAIIIINYCKLNFNGKRFANQPDRI